MGLVGIQIYGSLTAPSVEQLQGLRILNATGKPTQTNHASTIPNMNHYPPSSSRPQSSNNSNYIPTTNTTTTTTSNGYGGDMQGNGRTIVSAGEGDADPILSTKLQQLMMAKIEAVETENYELAKR